MVNEYFLLSFWKARLPGRCEVLVTWIHKWFGSIKFLLAHFFFKGDISWWWNFKYFLIFTPIWGRWTHFDQYFSDGLKPPTRFGFVFLLVILLRLKNPWVNPHHSPPLGRISFEQTFSPSILPCWELTYPLLKALLSRWFSGLPQVGCVIVPWFPGGWVY